LRISLLLAFSKRPDNDDSDNNDDDYDNDDGDDNDDNDNNDDDDNNKDNGDGDNNICSNRMITYRLQKSTLQRKM
jgi:hypothetical protein